MNLPCNECFGLCCKNIDQVPELKEFDLGNGTCIHLNSANQCVIYNTRPDICNIEKMYELKYKHLFTKQEFYLKNIEVCDKLQKLFKLKSIPNKE